MFWQCQRNADLPSEHIQQSQHLRDAAVQGAASKACLWLRGLPPKGDTFALPAAGDQHHPVGSLQWGVRMPAVRAYSDGSGGQHTSDPRLRRCGWGFTLVDQDEVFHAGAYGTLPGAKQTVTRAEICAAAWALEHAAPMDPQAPFTVHTDCSVLVLGFRAGPHSSNGVNSDMWSQFWQAVRNFPGSVRIAKVKAHLSEEDVLLGRISSENHRGNQQADAHAAAGAALHQPDRAHVRSVAQADTRAWKIQRRLLAIADHVVRERAAGPRRQIAASSAGPAGPVPKPSKAHNAIQAFVQCGHAPRWEGKQLRCTQCHHRCATTASMLEHTRSLGQCPGPHAEMRMILDGEVPMKVPLYIRSFLGVPVDASHQFGLKRGLLWCWKCGLFSATAVRGLNRACKGRPSPTSAHALERLKRGETPTPQVPWPLPEEVVFPDTSGPLLL